MVWLQILTAVTVCGAIIVDVAKNNRQDDKCKTDCNSCAFLKRRDHRSWSEFEYHCEKYNDFDKQPIFCAYYRKRSEEE